MLSVVVKLKEYCQYYCTTGSNHCLVTRCLFNFSLHTSFNEKQDQYTKTLTTLNHLSQRITFASGRVEILQSKITVSGAAVMCVHFSDHPPVT